jgi:hypothetical protein
MPTLPNPNAFDIYTNASGAIVQSRALPYALLSPRPASQLPQTFMRQPAPVPTPLGGPPPGTAPRGTPTIIAPAPLRALLPINRNYSPAEKASLVRQNAAALAMLRQGLQYPCWNPPARSFNMLFPGFANFRSMAQLLALESQVKRARRDWSGAINSNLDGLQFGSDMQRGGVMVSALVGISCEAIARLQAWPTVEHLQAQQARAAAKKLESIVSRHVTAADVMREEKWMGQASLMQLFTTRNWQQQLAATMGTAPTWRSNLSFLFVDKKRVLDNYTRLLDVTIANAKLPYRAPKQPLPSPDDPVTQIIAPGFFNSQWSFAHNETENGLLLLALALRAYRLEQGAYPASLSQLSPRYVKTTPRDPLAHDLAFRYKVRGKDYALYSVGPDGKDDNGKPITGRGLGSSRRVVQQDDRGDIVAGFNTMQSIF